jgi:acetylglutamate synthase
MKSITIKTYDLLNTYFSKNVTTIWKSPRRSADQAATEARLWVCKPY